MRISDWSSDVCSSDLLGELGPHLLDFFAQFLQHRLDIGPVEAHRGGTLLQLGGALPLGQTTRDAGQRAVLVAFARAFGTLVLFPSEGLRIGIGDRRLTRSDEHTSELQSLMRISSAVFCSN